MPARSQIRRVRVATESAVGVDGTGTISNFKDLRIKSIGAPRETQQFIPDARVRQRRVLAPTQNLGWKRGSMQMSGQLVSLGAGLDASATPSQDNLSVLLTGLLGGRTINAGSAVASGASATGGTVTGTQGARFPEGTIALVETGVGTGIYVGTGIDTRSTDALGFTHSVGFTPAVGARVMNCEVLYETEQPSATLQFLVEGEAGGSATRDDIFLYRACQGNLGITWPLGGEIDWTSQIQFGGWLHDDEFATPLGPSSAMGIATYDGSGPVIARNGHVVFTPAGGTTRTTPNIVELTFDPALTRQTIESFNATVEGVSAYELMIGQPVLTVTLPRSEAVEIYKDAMEAGTLYRCFAQAGQTAGRTLVLHTPTLQIIGMTSVDRNGLDYVQIMCACLADTGLTDQSTDILRAPYRIGRG